MKGCVGDLCIIHVPYLEFQNYHNQSSCELTETETA